MTTAEELVVARAEDLEPGPDIVISAIHRQRRHAAEVVRAAVVIGNRSTSGSASPTVTADVVSAVEMIEGRNRENRSRAHGVQPGEIDQVIALVFNIANAGGLLVGIVGNLVVIAAG